MPGNNLMVNTFCSDFWKINYSCSPHYTAVLCSTISIGQVTNSAQLYTIIKNHFFPWAVLNHEREPSLPQCCRSCASRWQERTKRPGSRWAWGDFSFVWAQLFCLLQLIKFAWLSMLAIAVPYIGCKQVLNLFHHCLWANCLPIISSYCLLFQMIEIGSCIALHFWLVIFSIVDIWQLWTALNLLCL